MPESHLSDNLSLTPSEAQAGLPGGSVSQPFAQTSWHAARSVPDLEDRTQVPLEPLQIMGQVQIPGYQILEELGRGGMGVVYKAIQLGLNRMVALKMILFGGHAGTEAVTRFRREAEAIAKLQHPHIVQIYEIGEQQGQPFFSLEYVSGGSLADHLRGIPQPALVAAQLTQTLARAMHVVHQHGIIHRDLKPANVLLAGVRSQESGASTKSETSAVLMPDPRLLTPKITDFGLARQESSDLTGSHMTVGTPSYMSPEQARGGQQINPATDIYALGAILYELLTGRPPFQGSTALETVLLVVSEEPLPPRLFQPSLPRDLETICLKCLHKEPAKRYATAEALAEDLRCFQEGRPITARPVGRLERAWRWCRRNRLTAGLLAAVFLALLAAVVSLSVGLWFAEEARAQAQHRSRQYRQALDDQTAFLLEDLLARQTDLRPEHTAFLQRALRAYAEFTRESGDDPDSRAGLAEAFHRVAKIRIKLGQITEGEEALRQARAVQERLVLDYPGVAQYRLHLARITINLSRMLGENRKHAEAETLLRAVLAELPPGTAAADHAREAEEVRALGQQNLGRLLEQTGRPAEAEVALTACRDAQRRLHTQDPDAVPHRLALALAENACGTIQAKRGRLTEAEASFQAAVRLLEPVLQAQPQAVEPRLTLISAYNNLAKLEVLQRNYATAEAATRKVIRLEEQLAAEFPANLAYRSSLADTYMQLGQVLRLQHRVDEAEQAYRLALGVQERLAADHPQGVDYRGELIRIRQSLAILHDHRGQAGTARQLYSQCLRDFTVLRQEHPELTDLTLSLAGMHCNYGLFLLRQKESPAGLEQFDKAVALLDGLVQRSPELREGRRFLRQAHWGRAQAQAQQAHHAEAAQAWAQVLRWEDSPSRDTRWELLLAQARAGRLPEALTAATDLVREEKLEPLEHYQAACLFARIAAATPFLPHLSPWADRALQHLDQARRQRFFTEPVNRDLLAISADLEVLRLRPDYARLLQDVTPRKDRPTP